MLFLISGRGVVDTPVEDMFADDAADIEAVDKRHNGEDVQDDVHRIRDVTGEEESDSDSECEYGSDRSGDVHVSHVACQSCWSNKPSVHRRSVN